MLQECYTVISAEGVCDIEIGGTAAKNFQS